MSAAGSEVLKHTNSLEAAGRGTAAWCRFWGKEEIGMSRNQISSVLKLKLVKGQNNRGDTVYTSKSWQDVNAAVSDDDLLALGTGMAVMQTAPLAEVIRIDTGELTA